MYFGTFLYRFQSLPASSKRGFNIPLLIPFEPNSVLPHLREFFSNLGRLLIADVLTNLSAISCTDILQDLLRIKTVEEYNIDSETSSQNQSV